MDKLTRIVFIGTFVPAMATSSTVTFNTSHSETAANETHKQIYHEQQTLHHENCMITI